jgi:hypothetical protein
MTPRHIFSPENLHRLLLTLAVLLVLIGMAHLLNAQAQPLSGYDLSWWSVDGGAGTLSAGKYRLPGIASQPDANMLASGSYMLYGGFWNSRSPSPFSRPMVFLLLIKR